ncbi:MAG: hypothetical protein H6694_09460 [Candidatus Latescibacteria bacterium]|nr:hypothetical protein [bacterium]MCB9514522.1 hypothetical protein [Candidatus Latescibacterota bacterium]
MSRAALAVLSMLLLPGVAPAAADAPPPAFPSDGVSLYYFHATLRCQTCLRLEASIDHCVQDEFAVELAEGWLDWRALNYELTPNSALAETLQLRGSELVVIRWQDGAAVDWQPIPAVWEAPDDDGVCAALKPAVTDYLRAQLAPAGSETP